MYDNGNVDDKVQRMARQMHDFLIEVCGRNKSSPTRNDIERALRVAMQEEYTKEKA